MNGKSIAWTEHKIGYHQGRIDAYEDALDIIEDLVLDLYGEKSRDLFMGVLTERLSCKIQRNKELLERLAKQGGATN